MSIERPHEALHDRFTRRKLVHFNLGHHDSWVGKCINKSIWLALGRYPWCTHGRCPPVANQIDLFMHFLGASCNGLVARPVEMDKLSSSDCLSVEKNIKIGGDIII